MFQIKNKIQKKNPIKAARYTQPGLRIYSFVQKEVKKLFFTFRHHSNNKQF